MKKTADKAPDTDDKATTGGSSGCNAGFGSVALFLLSCVALLRKKR